MSDRRIKVIAYSGYRGEEVPRTMVLGDIRIEVIQILKMWIEENEKNRTRKRWFEVNGNDGEAYKIYYDEKAMEWFYRVED